MKGNPQSIEQIVLNLTINAIQAVGHGHGSIRVATHYEENTGKIVLSVSDNGRGINPEIADKLFDPFVTDKQAEGGTGLGLSVTYSLVRAHEGEIRFTTEPGEGTTFTAMFPSTLKRKEVKILVVDDDDAVRDVLTQALKRRTEFAVENAADGIKACIKLGSFKPDLLVLDLFMPEMNGLEVCRVIKSDSELAELKVLITTGHPGHRLLDEMAKLGFDNVLSKPIDIIKFLETVGRVISQ
jgi:CheY-like chemotaxis protein